MLGIWLKNNPWQRYIARRLRYAALLLGSYALLLGLSGPVQPQTDALAGRPGLAEAEHEPVAIATCENLRASLSGFRQPQRRIDLWVTGPLTLVQSDGVLWYLAVCSSPAIR